MSRFAMIYIFENLFRPSRATRFMARTITISRKVATYASCTSAGSVDW